MTTYRHGALYVVEDARHHKRLERDLRAIDDRLFFEKQRTIAGEDVWCVVCDVGLDYPPMTLLEWRDDSGRPIPDLTDSIISRVQRMERDGGRLMARVVRANAARIEERRRRDAALFRDMAQDMVPRIEGRVRPVLHRGVHLRQSRDRRRERGERV